MTTRVETIQKLVDEALASPSSTAAANKVLNGVKHWAGLSIGARPLALEVHLPEAYVAKIMMIIARQGYMVPTQYENVYKFHGARFPMSYAGYIDDYGRIQQTQTGSSHIDPWRGVPY